MKYILAVLMAATILLSFPPMAVALNNPVKTKLVSPELLDTLELDRDMCLEYSFESGPHQTLAEAKSFYEKAPLDPHRVYGYASALMDDKQEDLSIQHYMNAASLFERAALNGKIGDQSYLEWAECLEVTKRRSKAIELIERRIPFMTTGKCGALVFLSRAYLAEAVQLGTRISGNESPSYIMEALTRMKKEGVDIDAATKKISQARAYADKALEIPDITLDECRKAGGAQLSCAMTLMLMKAISKPEDAEKIMKEAMKVLSDAFVGSAEGTAPGLARYHKEKAKIDPKTEVFLVMAKVFPAMAAIGGEKDASKWPKETVIAVETARASLERMASSRGVMVQACGYDGLACLYAMTRKNLDEAFKCARKALELDRSMENSLWLCVLDVIGRGDARTAISLVTASINKRPTTIAYRLLMTLYFFSDRWDKVESVYKEAALKFPIRTKNSRQRIEFTYGALNMKAGFRFTGKDVLMPLTWPDVNDTIRMMSYYNIAVVYYVEGFTTKASEMLEALESYEPSAGSENPISVKARKLRRMIEARSRPSP